MMRSCLDILFVLESGADAAAPQMPTMTLASGVGGL